MLALLRTPVTGKGIKLLAGRIHRAPEAELEHMAAVLNLLKTGMAAGLEALATSGMTGMTGVLEADPGTTKLWDGIRGWFGDFGREAGKARPDGTPKGTDLFEDLVKKAATGELGSYESDELEVEAEPDELEVEEGQAVIQLETLGDSNKLQAIFVLRQLQLVSVEDAKAAVSDLPARLPSMPAATAQAAAELLGDRGFETTVYVG